MLARTLLAGIQESVNPTSDGESVEESFGLKYENDFLDEAITESYWMSEAIESAFGDILHIDKVYHVADIKGEVQAFTENSTPEEIGVMLEGIVTGAATRVIDTVDKLISKLRAWFKKVIEQLGAIFASSKKFADKAEKIVLDKSSNSAKYGKYQYTTYKYDFVAGDKIITDLEKRLSTVDKEQPTQKEKEDAKAMPDEADEAQAAADVNNAAEDTSDNMDKAEEAAEISEWDQMMASIMEGLGMEDETVTENTEEGTTEETATVEESVEEVDVNVALESILADLVEDEDQISMESVDVILESANTSDVVSTICRQVSKGKAENQGEFVNYVKSTYRSNKTKKEIFTFFEDTPAATMLEYIRNSKSTIDTIKKEQNSIINEASKTLKNIQSQVSKAAGKDDYAYQKLSKRATTLTAFIGLLQVVYSAKIEAYKEAVGEYVRILKGLVVYKGDSTVSEATDPNADVKTQGDEAAAEIDAVSADGEKAVKDADKAPTEEACGGNSGCKKPTEEACGGNSGCKKGTTEAEAEVKPEEVPAEEPAASEDAPAEEAPAKESVELEDELSLFDAAWAYL